MNTSSSPVALLSTRSVRSSLASRWIAVGALGALLLGLAGCNTMAGAGQDISRGGQDLTHSAESHK